MREKKKNSQGRLVGLLPIFSKCESQYSKTGRAWETGLGAQQACRGAQQARMVGHDTVGWATRQPTTRPRGATTQLLVCASATWLGMGHDIINCIVTRERPGG